MSEHDRLCFKQTESSFQARKIINITVYERERTGRVNRNRNKVGVEIEIETEIEIEWSGGRLEWDLAMPAGGIKESNISGNCCVLLYTDSCWLESCSVQYSQLFIRAYSLVLCETSNTEPAKVIRHSLWPNWKRDFEENPGSLFCSLWREIRDD